MWGRIQTFFYSRPFDMLKQELITLPMAQSHFFQIHDSGTVHDGSVWLPWALEWNSATADVSNPTCAMAKCLL